MKFNEGDRVRFLNEAIEGVVIRVLSREQVEVIDSHGFAHIAREADLVRTDFGLEKKDFLDEQEQEPIVPDAETKASSKNKTLPVQTVIASLEPDQTVYAAVRLHKENSPLVSDFDLILVNNTSLSFCYTIAHRNGDHRVYIGNGILNNREEKLCGVFSQDELHRY